MKKCVTCKEFKQNELFRKNRNQCKGCYNNYIKNYLNTNQDQRIHNRELVSKRIKYRRQLLRDFINTFKDKPCVDCGRKFHLEAMEFDHLDPNTKKSCISKMVLNKSTKEEIALEIAKYELVCANCHRVRTFLRRNNGGRI